MPDNSRKLKFLNILILFLLAVSSGLLTAYCSKDNEGGEGFAHVNMIDNSFSPPQIRIPVGGTIQFRNIGGNPHNAVAVDRKWGTDKSFGNLVMVRDNKVKIVFPEKGYYPYLCTFHASPDGKVGMVGSVIVGDGDYKPAGKSGEKFSPVEKWSETTRKVPGQYPTIQNAVDAAKPGDLILISEGVYKEEVVVTTPSLTIRGVDRNKVIIDGGYVHGNGIMVVGADGVAIENMTARNATLNGFYWTGVKGYRGSYLTAHNNGDYGLYAFDSVDGVIEHSYASGSPDSGFYIGQCYPCKAIINDVVSEYNALGYSGTNAGGELYIVSSVWRNNIVGLAPNTLDRELLPPERESTLVANLVYDNNNATAPVGPLEYPSFGNGIMIAGGLRNIIERNVIVNHINNGILLILNLDENFWFSHGNRVRNNTIVNSNRADMSIVGPMATGNCFSGNSYRTTIPPLLETFSGCGKIRYPQGSDLSMTMGALSMMVRAASGNYPRGHYKKQPIPGPQENMPGGERAPVKPAMKVFESYKLDLSKVPLPKETETVLKNADKSGKFMAGSILPLLPRTFLAFVFHYIGFILPFVLFSAWTMTAWKDLLERTDLGKGTTYSWLICTILLPFIGSAAYHLAGKSTLPKWMRYSMIFGGAGFFILLFVYVGISLSSGIGNKQLE